MLTFILPLLLPLQWPKTAEVLPRLCSLPHLILLTQAPQGYTASCPETLGFLPKTRHLSHSLQLCSAATEVPFSP